MRDELQQGEDKPINRRNLMIVLGGLGALLLLSNIDGPGFSFISDDDETAITIESKTDEIDAKVERMEAAIEKRLEGTAERLEAAGSGTRLDEDELDAAIEELRDGDPARFLKTIETL
ncbi:hypothetical protein [Sphingosinicella microcystinivorans]|uniref:Uncharacterized protein n=1 Tax=Sphingosinicella microcystinivorans TaxID=335406 RepID=A0AAD1D335_SPHMI|nr:hypothetical protein [Sphingosinicella microcystinivorans]RKS89117.1 hypothetical protein DFR51_2331 [Sphingosinicella microcystinivorans]BBE32873.1 hypothetical protein SmB9_05310 [Sphingosinicella microcystinivorans]